MAIRSFSGGALVSVYRAYDCPSPRGVRVKTPSLAPRCKSSRTHLRITADPFEARHLAAEPSEEELSGWGWSGDPAGRMLRSKRIGSLDVWGGVVSSAADLRIMVRHFAARTGKRLAERTLRVLPRSGFESKTSPDGRHLLVRSGMPSPAKAGSDAGWWLFDLLRGRELARGRGDFWPKGEFVVAGGLLLFWGREGFVARHLRGDRRVICSVPVGPIAPTRPRPKCAPVP
jgi:hypothetical protein